MNWPRSVVEVSVTSELTLVEIKILRTAAELYLEKGYSATTTAEIARKAKVTKSNLHYHFNTKEDILFELTKAMLDFHYDRIKEAQEISQDNIVSYCAEVTVQIALCEKNKHARDLYLAIYSGEETLSYVKDWTAAKNYEILGKYLPDWSLEKFRVLENVCCCIERSALTEPCTDNYTIQQKIELTLSSLMKLHNISKDERVRAIKTILELDYISIGEELFERLTKYVNNRYKKMLDEAVKAEFY